MATYIVNALDTIILNDAPDAKSVIHEKLIFADQAIVNVHQSVHLSDGIKFTTFGKTVYSVNVYDSVSFSDTVKIVIPGKATDTARFLDASTATMKYSVTVSDGIALTDSNAVRMDWFGNPSDTVEFSENVLNVITYPLFDTVGFSDWTDGSVIQLAIDNLRITDSAVANVTYLVDVEDNVGFTEDKKWSNMATLSDGVNFKETNYEVRVRGDADDTAIFSDRATLYNRGTETSVDEAIFSDEVTAIITPYIKRIDAELIVTDDSNARADYRARFKEVMVFSDSVDNRMKCYASPVEAMGFSDQAHSFVTYADPLISANNIATFTDSCTIKVNVIKPFNYTKALMSGIDAVETVVYTAPKTTSIIMNMSLCNVIAVDILVTVAVNNGGVITNLRKDLPIAPGESFVINKEEESSFIIKEGDEIRITSSEPNSLDVYMAIMEQ